MRQRIWPVLVLALLCLAWSTAPAWSAAPKDDHPKAGAAEKHEATEGINIFAPRFDLGIWTIVVFLCLFFILKKYAWGPMLDGLTKREENIRGALEQAKQAKRDAEKVQAELQQKLAENAQQIASIMDEARRDAQNLIAEAKSQSQKDIQAERERLHREVTTAKDQALQEIMHRSADLATLISAKTIQRQLNVDDHRQLVDAALADLHAAGSQRQKEISIL